MTSYKVAFIKTNAFKKKVVGKNYYEGYDNQVEGSVPIYPFYFTEDYSRSWDSGNTFSYSSLRNGEIESIDYDSSKLTVKFLNYDAFSYEEIVYEVGVPTTDEKIVDPSDHSKLFPFTPTEILVANSLNSGEPIIESLRESIMEFEQNKGKIPKMAETVEAEEYCHVCGTHEDYESMQHCALCKKMFCRKRCWGSCKCGSCEAYICEECDEEGCPPPPPPERCWYHGVYDCSAHRCRGNFRFAETFGAELDEIQDDVAIVRNRMGDAVGNIDLNDHDVEGVSIEIYNDKGVLLEEIVLGAETYLTMNAETVSKEMVFNIDIDDAEIENEDELEEKGYTQEEIEEIGDELNNVYDKDYVLEDLRDNHLDGINGDITLAGHSVYLKSRDEMVDDIDASVYYTTDIGDWHDIDTKNAETFEARGNMNIPTDCLNCGEKLQVVEKKDHVKLVCYGCSDFIKLPKSHLSDNNKRELIMIQEGFEENEDNEGFRKKYPHGLGHVMGAETFEARTYRKSQDRSNRFVRRPDGKHNPGHLRGYDRSPRGTPDSKLDIHSRDRANTKVNANIKGKEDLRDSIKFEANAKSGDKVYIITRRCEDYSAYRELDLAVFSSLTEARKKFNFLFKEEKENYYADETIADAKAYMRWGEVGWGIESFMADDMLYELREQTIGNNAMSGFYFDAESFEANAKTFKKRKIDAETRKKIGKAVADEIADGFPDIFWSGLENGYPMTEKGFVDYVRIGCDEAWPLESDFREMRIVLEDNGYYDGWNEDDYEEPYTDEYLLKTMWSECKRQIIARAKRDAPKIVAQAKKEYGDKYDAESEIDLESHGKMNWTLNYDDYPNCCPFHQKYTDVMSNSMPCGDVLWGQGFSVDIEGTQYDIWGHEVND